jgi:predicted CXXCH cytochrome family protein
VHHSSNTANLLRGSEFNLCISCHDRGDVADEQGHELVDVKALHRDKPVHHGPFAQKSCASCHDPHFSKHHRLLKAEYPATFYADYTPQSYQLCFDCHDPLRITVDKTRELTGFRDGSDNLHYVHVVKADPGRSCRACHEDHGTDLAHLVRSSVPYGSEGWRLPLNYTATKNGGSCEKTCHKRETYDNGGSRPTDVAQEYKQKHGSSFPVPPAAQVGKKGKGASAKKSAAPEEETYSMEVFGPGGQGVDPVIKAQAHFNYAKRLYRQNRLSDALAEVLRSLELHDWVADAHALAGVIYAKQKNCELADHEFQKALDLDGKNSNAKKGKKLLAKLTGSGKCVTPVGQPPSDEPGP